MKKVLTMLALIQTTLPLQAQNMGEAAAASSEYATNSNWQNWAFAGSAIATITAGVIAISVGTGEGSTSH